jgi:orotate phosphoribosyltransferase
LKTGDTYTYVLKSGRESPYFLNIGDVNYGSVTATLARAYASTIADVVAYNGNKWKEIAIYGIPEKGVAFASPTTIQLWQDFGIDAYWLYTRKGAAKTYGEATNLSGDDVSKMIIGKVATGKIKILLLDDVLTTGDTKYAAVDELHALLGDPKIAGLVIAVDRQEVGTDGKNAVQEFTANTNVPVYASLNTTEIRRYLRTKEDYEQSSIRIARYLRTYGTDAAKDAVISDGLEE